MELAEGGELFEKIVESQRFSEKRAAEIMQKMLSAIKHLHQHEICHRDLKPENFLFSTLWSVLPATNFLQKFPSNQLFIFTKKLNRIDRKNIVAVNLKNAKFTCAVTMETLI